MKEESEKENDASLEGSSEENPPAEKKKRSVGKILFRGMMYIVFFVFILIAAAGIVLEYYFPAEEARKIAERQVTKILKLPFKIQKLGFSLLSGAQLDNVILGFSSNPIARVRKIVLDYDLTKLLQGKLVINQILVDHPQLTAISKNGTWNFQPLLEIEKSPSPTPPPDKGEPMPTLPVTEIDINEVRIREASANLDQDGKLSGHIEGLSLEAKGKASLKSIDLKLKVIMKPGNSPNIGFQSTREGSFKTNLFTDLEFSARDLHRLSVTGKLGLEKTQMKEKSLPNVTTEMDAEISQQPESLNLKKLWVSLGEDNRIKMRASAANFSKDPSFKLEIEKASFQLNELLNMGKPWLPPLSGKGILNAEALKISGNLPGFKLEKLKIEGGTLSTENLWANYPDQKLQLVDLDTNIELKEVVLENSQLANTSLNINLQLEKGIADKAEIKNWRQSLNFTAKGIEDVLWEFGTNINSLHYDHPEAKDIYLPAQVNGSGHLINHNLNNLKISYKLGNLANGAIAGTIKNFGKDSVQLEQNFSLNLPEAANLLPQKYSSSIPENLQGTARAETTISCKLDDSFMPTQLNVKTNLELAGLTAHVKQPSIKINNLNTGTSFPLEFDANKGVKISNLEFHTELDSAEALESWEVGKINIKTNLKTQGFHQLNPQFGTIPIKMDTRIEMANLSGPILSLANLKTETNLKADVLSDDVRNTRIKGNLSFDHLLVKEMLKSNDVFSRFNLDVHDKSLTRVRLSQKTQINKPSFHQNDMDVELKSVSLETSSRQNLKLGNVNLDNLSLKIPGMFNSRLKATLKEWGKDFEIDGKIESLKLESVWNTLPENLKSGHENLQTGGTLVANLQAKGSLPENKEAPALQTLTSLKTKAEVILKNGLVEGLVLGDQKISAGSLNLKTKLISENGNGEFSGKFSGRLEGLTGAPLKPEFGFNYALTNMDHLKIKQHQLKLMGKGVEHSVEGHIDGLKSFINGRNPVQPEELLRKLDIKLGSTNILNSTQATTSTPLYDGTKVKGTLISKTEFLQKAGKSLNLKGSMGFDNFSLHLPSGVVLKNLNGTFPYTKTMILDMEQLKDKPVGFSPSQKKFFTPLRNFSRYKNILRADSLEVNGQSINNIGLDVVFKDNQFMTEKFIFDVLGGTVGGNLFLVQNRQGPVIKFSTEFAGIDSSKLLPISTENDIDSKIDGNLQVELKIQAGLEGQPVTLDQLSVSIAITRIGAQTLDRLLLFLDPEESKPAIMDTRAKLKLATPHRVKIVLKNGNLNFEAWLKSDLLGIIKAPELKRVPIARLKRFNTIHKNLQSLKSLEKISNYLSARGLQFEEGKLTLH